MNTITKTNNEQLARPLEVLAPLIKEMLEALHDAQKEAGMPYFIKIGEALIESKAVARTGKIGWNNWIKKHFHLSQSTAARYMAAARKVGAGATFDTLSESRGDKRTSHSKPRWTASIDEALRNLGVENYNLAMHQLSEAKEQALEKKLAIQLIDIGYKVLSVKLHPDKGGSDEAMKRLNNVRKNLKESL